MPQYLLTFRCHPNDTQLFEDIHILLLNKIRYDYYSIEKDNTCDRHLHIITKEYADRSKIIQVLNAKYFQNAWKALEENNTRVDRTDWKKQAVNVEIIDEDKNLQYRIGYIFKENPQRRCSGAASVEDIKKATDYYLIKSKYDKENDLQKERENIILLNTRTAYAKILDYSKRTNIRLDDPQLPLRMLEDRFAFANMSDKQTARIFRELRIMEKCPYKEDKQLWLSHVTHADNDHRNDYTEERDSIERLMEILETKELTENEKFQIQNIKNKHFITT